MKEVVGTTVPMDDGDYAKLLALTEDWGVRTGWQEVDGDL